VDYKSLANLGKRFRAKRFSVIVELLEGVLRQKDNVNILDVGGLCEYWVNLPEELAGKCHITLINPQEYVTEGKSPFPELTMTPIVGDGCDLSQYDDKSFDLVHSNSVIEHVESFERMIKFASESRRVGNAIYAQTPYLWFPIEPHYGTPFLHWLPHMHHASIESKKGVGVYKRKDNSYRDYAESYQFIKHCILLNKSCFRYLYSDCEYRDERIGPITKSLVAIRPYSIRD